MTDCIFCKIVSRQIPGHVIYEDDDVLAFLDISQTTKGHTLVIPKIHQADIFEIDETAMRAVFAVVPKITHALKATLGCGGINVVSNNGKIAGQTVFHYHVHLIPRYPGDEFKISFANNTEANNDECLASLKKQIKTNL